MNSTEIKKQLLHFRSNMDNDIPVYASEINKYIDPIIKSILINILGIKLNLKSSCSSCSAMTINKTKKSDRWIGYFMENIAMIQHNLCCNYNHDNSKEIYIEEMIYSSSVLNELLNMVEYAEEEYGVFEILN